MSQGLDYLQYLLFLRYAMVSLKIGAARPVSLVRRAMPSIGLQKTASSLLAHVNLVKDSTSLDSACLLSSPLLSTPTLQTRILPDLPLPLCIVFCPFDVTLRIVAVREPTQPSIKLMDRSQPWNWPWRRKLGVSGKAARAGRNSLAPQPVSRPPLSTPLESPDRLPQLPFGCPQNILVGHSGITRSHSFTLHRAVA